MIVQKYPDGDCRRVGAGYKPRTSRGRGHGANVGASYGSAFRPAGMAPDAPVAAAGSPVVSSGAGLSAMAGMLLLARLIGRKRGR